MGKPYKALDPPPLTKILEETSQPLSTTGVYFTGALYVGDLVGKGKSTYASSPVLALELFTWNLCVIFQLTAFYSNFVDL